jgi:hypothetical protein
MLAALSGLGYSWFAGRGQIPSFISVNIALTLALILALSAAHEGVHGLAMMAFGARPTFGILKSGRVPWGFYTTSPGRRFTRRRYLIVALAPLAVIAPLGIPLCWSPIGGDLWFPFAVHLGGCIGDLTIAWHVLSGPREIFCEDLADGVRLWRSQSGPTP